MDAEEDSQKLHTYCQVQKIKTEIAEKSVVGFWSNQDEENLFAALDKGTQSCRLLKIIEQMKTWRAVLLFNYLGLW